MMNWSKEKKVDDDDDDKYKEHRYILYTFTTLN